MPLAGVAVIGRLEHMLGTANDSVELEGETFHADKVAPVGDRKAARWRINLLDDALAEPHIEKAGHALDGVVWQGRFVRETVLRVAESPNGPNGFSADDAPDGQLSSRGAVARPVRG